MFNYRCWMIYGTVSRVGNCNKFYFTFKFEYQMWVQIYQKFEKDWIPISHLSNWSNPKDIRNRPYKNAY
jgi:hypothetical protein